MINEEVCFRRFRVRMHGSSMSASYTGTVDVWASDSDDAIERAYHGFLNPRTRDIQRLGPQHVPSYWRRGGWRRPGTVCAYAITRFLESFLAENMYGEHFRNPVQTMKETPSMKGSQRGRARNLNSFASTTHSG
jgi:hypothetical protein